MQANVHLSIELHFRYVNLSAPGRCANLVVCADLTNDFSVLARKVALYYNDLNLPSGSS